MVLLENASLMSTYVVERSAPKQQTDLHQYNLIRWEHNLRVQMAEYSFEEQNRLTGGMQISGINHAI